jgi:hypothetical protein
MMRIKERLGGKFWIRVLRVEMMLYALNDLVRVKLPAILPIRSPIASESIDGILQSVKSKRVSWSRTYSSQSTIMQNLFDVIDLVRGELIFEFEFKTLGFRVKHVNVKEGKERKKKEQNKIHASRRLLEDHALSLYSWSVSNGIRLESVVGYHLIMVEVFFLTGSILMLV